MDHQFGIAEDGNVYRYEKWCGWRLLGRLPCVLGEPTPVGREVRAWWKALVESDEPLEFLEDGRRTSVPATEVGNAFSLAISEHSGAQD
jgi:hypothetical protein